MSRRIVNGSSFSENGWPLVDTGSCVWVKVPGTNVSLQVQAGPPAVIMPAWAADWNAHIEPLRDADSACYTAGNSVLGGYGQNNGSNHLGGTAEDLNWGTHPFQVRGSLNPAQMAVLAEMEEFYEGSMFWAGRWENPVDEMHSQMGYDTYDQKNDRPQPWVLDFIARKIRPDGFSTFRRAGSSGDNAPGADAARVLADATGLTVARATAILPQVSAGLRLSECVNVNRIAMWLAQIGHESDNFNATEEYQNGDESQERWLYKGRTWIQITWASNYAGFSEWAHDRGICPTTRHFLDHPHELAQQRYAGIGPAWYWTVARRDINALSDARDLVTVTHRINGGENGLYEAGGRRDRYNRALAVGDALLQLLALGEDDDEMGAVDGPSWSIYRTTNDNIGPCNPVTRANNAMAHEDRVEALAEAGLPWEAGLLAALEAGHLPASKQPGAPERAAWLLDHKVAKDVAATARRNAAL